MHKVLILKKSLNTILIQCLFDFMSDLTRESSILLTLCISLVLVLLFKVCI